MRRAQAGDRAAFDHLVERYRAALRAIAFLRTSDRDAAQDLAQETLVRAWEKLPTLRDPAAFLPWLKVIVARSCLTWHRQARPENLSLETAPETSVYPGLQPLEVLLKREWQRELRQALVSLPDVNRIALLMHVWEGASYQEIARFTGVRLTTVEGRIYRARKQLQHLLRDEEHAFFGQPARRWRPAEETGETHDNE